MKVSLNIIEQKKSQNCSNIFFFRAAKVRRIIEICKPKGCFQANMGNFWGLFLLNSFFLRIFAAKFNPFHHESNQFVGA